MAKIRLSKVQVRWLNDPRKYSNPEKDRTFRALIDKGAVQRGKEYDYGTGRCDYIMTTEGQSALARANRVNG